MTRDTLHLHTSAELSHMGLQRLHPVMAGALRPFLAPSIAPAPGVELPKVAPPMPPAEVLVPGVVYGLDADRCRHCHGDTSEHCCDRGVRERTGFLVTGEDEPEFRRAPRPFNVHED